MTPILATLLIVLAVLQFLFNVLLVAALVTFWRVLNADARKRGLLDAVDLLHRRKRWYA